jgi:hypothetical protein
MIAARRGKVRCVEEFLFRESRIELAKDFRSNLRDRPLLDM